MNIRPPYFIRTRRRYRHAGPILVLLGFAFLFPNPVSADIRLVTGEGEYRMGAHDTKLDAEHLAVEAAKRNALEQVATYLESVTVVRDLNVTTDEIRSYSAGLLLLLDQQVTLQAENNEVVIHANIVAQVDSDQVVSAITALRENEDARRQLVALRAELDELHQELEQANVRLAMATDPQQVRALSQERQELLDQARSNDLLSQAWTGWTVGGGNATYAPWGGFVPPQALVVQAWQAAPWNRNVQSAQQKILPATTLPQYSRTATPRSPGHTRLQAVVRPWSGAMSPPRMFSTHPPSGPRPPYSQMRPSGTHHPRYSGSGSGRGGGRGRR